MQKSNRFVLEYTIYSSGWCVIKERHTGYTVEAETRTKARSVMLRLLQDWTGSPTDEDEPHREVETVYVSRY